MNKTLLAALAFLLAALIAGAILWQPGGTPAGKLPAGADFVLQSADGPVDSKALRGKVLLIYFGYTNCPDICPASLAAGGQVLKALASGERERVRLLMVSVDPERDTLSHLKEYTAFFHPAMTGVTGTPAQIASLAQAFGAGYRKQPAKADGTYAVDHTTATYVVGPDGKLAAVLELGVSTDSVLQAVRKLL